MISRAGVGQPWLIGQLMAEMNQENFKAPTLSERGVIFLEHVNQLEKLLHSEKFAILEARKFAKYYARDLPEKLLFCNTVNKCETLIQLNQICADYFGIYPRYFKMRGF